MRYLIARRHRNCTVWCEALWEIFSAEDSAIKFLLSDNPVVVYNCDCYPSSEPNRYPRDPNLWWRGTRVLYALSPDRLLVLSHLEHVDDPSRTKARRMRRNARANDMAIISYTDIVNDRKFSPEDVANVNYIIKSRASRYVASVNRDWLHPESIVEQPRWCDLDTLFYSKHGSMHTKSEIIMKYDDGSLLFSNAFGEHETVPGWFVKQQEAKRHKSEKPDG